MRAALALLLLIVLVGCSSVPVPEGFRMNRYKAPVPHYLPGGQRVNTAEARQLHADGALFIDVIGSGKLLTRGIENDWLVVHPHLSIPHSIWLPDVGRGALSQVEESYFKAALAHVTGNDHTRALVFFCLKSCWMSWNAAKRAAQWGYSQVYWYSEGVDGWGEAGNSLVEISPFSR